MSMFKGKHLMSVKVWLTQQESADLARLAADHERKVSAMARYLVGQALYGELPRIPYQQHTGQISTGLTP